MMKYIFLAIIAVVLIFFLLPSGYDTKEIELVLDKVLEAGKKKDLDGMMEHFSLQYKDEYGASYPVVKRMIMRVFDKFDSFDGEYSNLTASIGETDAGEKEVVANLDIYVLGIKEGGIPKPILGNEDSPENITVTLRKSTLGGWNIVKVEGLDRRFE